MKKIFPVGGKGEGGDGRVLYDALVLYLCDYIGANIKKKTFDITIGHAALDIMAIVEEWDKNET